MGCPSEVIIGENLVFSVCTYTPATRVLTDADAVPPYRVYEDETAVPILTGTMPKLDDANTTGFYTELIECTAANGFEDGKSYTIYVEALVGAVKIGFSFGFKAVAGWATEAKQDAGDTVTAAVKAVTDLLPNAGALSDLATILADTAELQTDWHDGGRLDLIQDAIQAVTDLLPNAGALSDLATILADTAELQTDWANDGRLDLLLDAALADTNELQGDWVNGGRLDLLIDHLTKLLEADVKIDTTATPWELQILEKNTANVLLLKALKQPDATNVTSTDHIVGQKVHTT